MSTPVAPQFQPVHIGEEANPPIAVAPDPSTLFAARAHRFGVLAPDHQLAGYLLLLAGIAGAQAAIMPVLPPLEAPDAEAVARATEYGMPPLQRTAAAIDAPLLATLDYLLDAVKPLEMPEAARAALDGVLAADDAERRVMITNVLSDSVPFEEIAEHVLVAAAVQVHFARLAATLDAGKLASVADGACPACGGPPVSSSVVGWRQAQSARFATCACCSTQWHVVRVKCVACGSTKGIHYFHPQGTPETLKAECCDTCHSYLKILRQIDDPALDPVADDVASAGLDLLVKEQGYRRAGFNVFIAGF